MILGKEIVLESPTTKVTLRASETDRGLEIDVAGTGQRISIQRDGEELSRIGPNGGIGLLRGSPVNVTAASLTTAQGGNKDLKYTCKSPGVEGNTLKVQYVVEGEDTPLSVDMAGQVLVVNCKTTAGGIEDSTAAEIKAKIESNSVIDEIFLVEFPEGTDGSGKPGAMAATSLAGGQDATPGAVGDMYADNSYIYRCVAPSVWKRAAMTAY